MGESSLLALARIAEKVARLCGRSAVRPRRAEASVSRRGFEREQDGRIECASSASLSLTIGFLAV